MQQTCMRTLPFLQRPTWTGKVPERVSMPVVCVCVGRVCVWCMWQGGGGKGGWWWWWCMCVCVCGGGVISNIIESSCKEAVGFVCQLTL